jgi:hypothetical protein
MLDRDALTTAVTPMTATNGILSSAITPPI